MLKHSKFILVALIIGIIFSAYLVNNKIQTTYDEAYEIGHESGFNEGYDTGYNVGYNSGHSDGFFEGLFTDTTTQETTSTDSALNSYSYEEEATDKQSITVYITKTGSKYHKDGCQYLSQSKIPITLQDAIDQGYTPCSKCF